jgi:hypothetical protein
MVMPMSLACDAMVSPRVGRPPRQLIVSAFKHMVQTMSKRFQLVKCVAVAYLEQSIQTDENNRRGMYLWTMQCTLQVRLECAGWGGCTSLVFLMPLTARQVTCNVALVNLAATVLGRVDRVLIGGHARAEEDVLAHAPVGAQDVLELGDARALGALRGGGAADGARVGLVGL